MVINGYDSQLGLSFQMVKKTDIFMVDGYKWAY